MARLAIVRDTKFQDHKTPASHPESPGRLAAIDKALDKSRLISRVKALEPRPAREEELTSVHREHYIEMLKQEADIARKRNGLIALDADTWMSPATYDTAKLAAGAGFVAVDAIAEPETHSSFVVVRPPGHHALADRPMGFCLFNNIALAVRYAQQKLGFKRIFVIDWDVHHGNGTQDMFYVDPSVFFTSFHQYPFWPPDSGWYGEDGAGEGKGYNMNIPLPAGTGDRGYLAAWHRLVEPVCEEYQPDLIMLSAGYDAHREDPLGGQQISTAGYGELSQKLLKMSQAGNTKVVGFLEGGYNTRALSEAVVATMSVLGSENIDAARETLLCEPAAGALSTAKLTGDASPDLVDERIDEVRRHFSGYWKSLR